MLKCNAPFQLKPPANYLAWERAVDSFARQTAHLAIFIN